MKRLFKKFVVTMTLLSMVLSMCAFTASATETNLADYEPQRVMATSVANNAAGLNVSWVNPKAELSAVKIYKVTDTAEIEITDANLDKTSGTIVTYTDESVENGVYATYKLRFEFIDGNAREVYTSGMAGKRINLALPLKSPSNQLALYGPVGFNGGADLVKENIGNPYDEYSIKISSNQKPNNNVYFDFCVYGGNNVNGKVKPGIYRAFAVWKGTATAVLDMYINGGSYWRAEQNKLALYASPTSRTGQPSSTFAIQDTEKNKWQMILFRFKNISQGELYIDTISMQRLKDGATDQNDNNNWENIFTQEFAPTDTNLQPAAPNPTNVSCKYTTEDAMINWTVPEVRKVKRTFKEGEDTLYCTYTNVYEKINGKEYLRAMLPNSGKATDSITLKNYVTGDYVLKTHRDAAHGDNDFEGDGSYSDGVSLNIDKVVLDNPTLDNTTVSFKVGNNSNENIAPAYIIAVYNSDGMLKNCYIKDTDTQIAANGGKCDVTISDVQIGEGDSARLMVWNTLSGMKPILSGKRINVK